MEELLHWLEVRISSSLRPRPDDIKTLLMDHTYRTCLSEFLKNEDVHTLYVYFKLSKASLAASLCPPPALQSKCTCFIKLGTAPKLTLENIANNVISVDCAQFPLKYFDMVLHQIYLPLLCNDNVMGGRTPNTDKIIDILHRFTGNLEIIAGHAEGSIVLPIPSLELLRNPSLFNKHGATIHVMETTVIGWIRQIKLVLKHDPLVEIKTQGLKAGIYHEEDMWKLHIHNLQSISRQLSSVEAREIVSHLEQAKSMYGHSIAAVTEDVKKALSEAAQNLTFLKPLLQWFDQLKSAMSAAEKQKTFFPMLHSLFLVWIHSRYYHQNKVFINLLRLMSNETVKIARDLLGTDVLHSPQAYSFLKEALKICATFRGNYLDIKDKADKINSEKNEENANQMLKKSKDIIWNTPLYRQLAPKLIGLPSTKEKKQVDEQPLWVDSPWPPHNSACFQNMNMFMERCNNALDLVETMRHFQVLKSVAAVGGAGTSTLDAMVQDIWDLYCTAKETFDHQIKDIFSTDRNSAFEKAFFDFRTTIKNLEHQLGDILRCSFEQCPNITSQLRLLEVFEGISRRDVVKDHLKDKDQQLVSMFMEELTQVNDMYLALESSPPLHINMTPTVSNLLWVKALKARISDPMTKLRTVSPLTLEGDTGWKLRHMYTDTAEQLERFETNLITSWLSAASKQLGDSLKLPLLRAAGLRHGQEEFPYKIELNLNPDFLVYLREAQYLLKPPFKVKLPESIEPLVSNLDMNKFKILSTRLEMVASKYNDVMKTISYHQRPLFEKKLLKSYEILKDGMHFFTWSMDESTDYTELAISCICTDLHINFSIVTNNYKIITELTTAWCTANLDIFTCRDFSRSYSITELMTEQKIMEQELRSLLIPDGQRIHCLVQQSFIACGISEASPPWQDYIMHIDALVLQGLKKVTITTLASMLNSLLDCDNVPILSVDVQLINSEAAFNPPLDRSTSDRSVIEIVEEWLEIFLLRGSCVKGLSSFAKGGYQEYLSEDDEALQLIGHILQQMEKSMLDCQALLEVFKNYTSVWKQDINVEFQNFLHGKQSVKPSVVEEGSVYEVDPVTQSSNGSTTRSENVSVIEAERSFILPKDLVDDPSNRPLLQDFDSEISAYKTARDSIQRMPDLQRCGWIQVDFRPVKQVLSAYALRWMWIFTNYLTDLTTSNLKSLDSFLKRTEPQIESITGEERDTGSFMKMMRLFNEVSAKQVEMDVQFAVLQRTVTLLGKHDTQLPTESEVLFRTMPARWNSMKTKVSLAKQRLGPRIQQEADRVIRDLERFQHKLDALGPDIENSEVYRYTCAAQEAFMVIQNFSTRLQSLQKEAKDLKELQELLETTVVDFSILINCEDLLQNLHLMWQHVDLIHKEQDTWKKELWQNLDTEELYKRTSQQLRLLQSLPGEVQEWDVYKQTAEAVNIMHFTLPLIEDLSNPAMRTRHWNQLVRQTGGMLRVTAESLKAMTLGDLLAMDLQKHTGEVRSTVQRAIRDVTIESSLKNCEEVWLSRIFELRPHSRIITSRAHNEEIASSVSGSHYTKGEVGRNTTTRSSRRMSRQSDKGFYLSKKGGRGSTMSLYESLKNIEELGTVMLLRSTDSIFEELEHHQLLLTTMQPYAEAGSFLDELIKWRKKLQVIETTVQLWLLVQEKWTQLEEVFSTLAFCVAMPREAVLFADAHHHFCRLMKSVEDNPNILQNCMRRGLQSLLEVMNYKLERCQRAVRHHLEQRRLAFPRFFFLSLEDTFNIVCYGYDLSILSGFVVKIFQHVHSLIYDISESNSETGCHNILGVRSFLKEELYLTQPLECRGPVESWLPQLVSSIQSSLQHHLQTALQPTKFVLQRRKEIHSAGARRVVIDKSVSEEPVSIEDPTADKRKTSLASSVLPESSCTVSSGDERPCDGLDSKHWVLGTLSDVAYLSTHIKFSRTLKESIIQQDNNESIQGCLKDLTEGIELAAKILNEIPQKDIRQQSKGTSKAERKGNGQDEEQIDGSLCVNGEVPGIEKDGKDEVLINKSLSAGDAVKLTNYILLLLYQRDVAAQFLSRTAPIWKLSQPLCYEYDDSTMNVNVRMGDSEINYGYEYQGSAEHMLITPLTERVLFGVMAAVSSGVDTLCISPQGSGKRSTVQEVCLALGKPLFSFNLTNTTDYSILHDICKGLAASGAWISINGLDLLPQSSLTLLAQLLQQVQSARHYGKETVTLLLEEIPLNPAGACIALINRTPNGIVRWTDSQSCNLPNTLLDCFRILGVSDVPANVILEAKLLLKGFSNVTFLAQKLSDLLDSIAKLYKPTLSASGLSDPGKHLCSSVYGLTNLLDEAGNILQSLQERHKQYQAVEGLANTDEDWQLGNEDKALLIAIRRCWLPQLSADKSRVLKALVAAEWSNTLNSLDILNDNSDIDGPIPTVIAVKYGPGQQVPSSESTDETSVPSAIIKAAEKCHIFPSNTFVSKVSHLVELASKFQTVVVTGPAGCGKTDCIKTYLEVLREQGKKVNQHTVFIKALQPGHLLGFMNEESGWVDGLLPKILRKYCQQHTAADSNQVDILHLDGEIDHYQMQLMQNILCGADFFITENNERIRISDSLQLFWEVETLANVSPSVLCCLGILTMTRTDTDWKLPIKTWMKTLTEDQQQLLHQLNETFLEPCLMFLNENHIFPQQGDQRNATPRTYFLSEANVVQTLCRIFKALIQHVPDMMPEDTRKYFIFSCIWSFGTWLDSHERTIFSNWWRRTFRNDYTFPTEGQVWDYHIDTDTRQFVRWHDTLSSYSVSQGQGMASETFVHMLQTEQLLYLSGLLTTSGCPVMLAGDAGCGKTAIIQEIRNSLCTGDVAEMLELQIPINGSTDPRKLWGCLKERLEWRHGTLHTPTGNKKLLCLLDDLNLAKVDKHGNQPVCEFVRQLLDHGRVFDPTSLKLKTISDIIFLVTWNIAAYKSYSIHQLLRHFCLFNCQYPSQNDQFGIFSTILNAHFMQPVTEHKAETMCAATNDCLQGLLSTITAVSIELQERLRTVFLGTSQRCHYIFTLRDLAKIFRNICLSLDGSTTPEKLLLLWKHECEWVYGHKMSSTVDYNRYRVEYAIAAKKGFTNEDELQIILSPHQPLYSNIVEDDGGLITTVAKQQDAHLQRRIEKTNSTIHTLDGYQQTFNLVHMKQLLTEALREYNKVNPRMNITFYESGITHHHSDVTEVKTGYCPVWMPENNTVWNLVLNQTAHSKGQSSYCELKENSAPLASFSLCSLKIVPLCDPSRQSCCSENTVHLLCRLTRNLWSPNGSAHTLLCGEGCARSSASLARLAAHLSGFNVVQPGSLNKSEKDEQRANHFKSQLVDCYVKAGLKGQKTLILLTEEEIDNTALVHMAEFVVFGSVAHLFTSEQQATIANALRSEVTNAGLTYSKERSWNLFLQAVQQNVCWFLIYSRTGSTFYKWCLEFSSLINSINIYFIPHWSRKSLVEHASYQLEDLDMFNTQEKENICHLLSSMHLSITKNDTLMQGKYSNITNTTFENFTQCFIALVKTQHETVLKQHEEAMEALGHIAEKMKSHEKLIDELKHQKVVFEEHKEGTLKILYQIAQDKAVVEQKIQIVHQHFQKIQKFQELLPAYQLAHEKAQYKCSAILEYIKELVRHMDVKALGELRAMQKPDVDIEELMASIIIILKSPNTDLTWAKGAKRQMANIDRFLNELLTFSNTMLPQSTLELLETNIKKAQFTPQDMERKAGGNVAAGTLLRWLQGAVRYYRILTSKVKPLQGKVEEMTVALKEAEEKMTALQQKKKELLVRLSDMEKSFEEATVHKNKQQQRTMEISQKLEQASTVAQLLEEENKKYAAIISSLNDRLSHIPGSTAMAAGLVSYLGAYEHHFRQYMLTVEWPMALKERGFPLMIDSIDPVKGRVIQFSLLLTSDSPIQYQKPEQNEDIDGNKNEEMSDWYPDQEETRQNGLSFGEQPSPIITEELYEDYIMALLMRIVKEAELQAWRAKDWTPQQMENAAILSFSWHRPVLLIDPCFEGEKWILEILKSSSGKSFSSINLQTRQDNSVLTPIEKTILSGCPLILNNYSSKWDDLLMPLIDHCNANVDKNNYQDSSSIISFNGHRLLCSDQFKLYLAVSEVESHLNTDIRLGTIIINYSPSKGSVQELLLRRAFAELQPDLHHQLKKLGNVILEHQQHLNQLEEKTRDCFVTPALSNMDNTMTITTLFNEKKEVSKQLKNAKSDYDNLLQARDILYPLALRGARFYFILKSLQCLAAEYYFSLDSFLKLFDSVVGIQVDTQGNTTQMHNQDFQTVSLPVAPLPSDSETDQLQATDKHLCKDSEDTVPAPEGHKLSSTVGAHCFSLSSNQIRKLMDQLTRAVYHSMIQSLLPEHSIQACALLFLCTKELENENAFTEEELAFFAKGSCAFAKTKGELFGSNLNPPSWLPQERWDDLMALSELPAPLKRFCVKVTENSSAWERWYNSDYPDVGNKDDIYNEKASYTIVHFPECGDIEPQITDFHRLLVLRALRPDRFPSALSRYVRGLAGDLALDNLPDDITEIARLEENILGVLVIMPTGTNISSYGGAVMSREHKITICAAAKEKGIPLFTVSMRNGNNDEVKAVINDTINQNGWLVIENLQLASKATLKNLWKSLTYATKMQASQKEERRFCAWLLSETGASIPKNFLAHLKKVSWHVLLMNQMSRKELLRDVTYIDSLPGLLSSAILLALDQIKEEIYEKLRRAPISVRNICFGICVLHGILQTLKLFPRTGLNHLADMGPIQLNQAIDAVLSVYNKTKAGEPFAVAVEEGVNNVYISLTPTLEGAAYIQALVHEIICCCQKDQSFLVTSHLAIPLPPENLDPTEYSSWLISHLPENFSVKELFLPRATEKASSETYASEFMLDLATVYDSMEGVLPLFTPEVNYPAKYLTLLRASIDTVLEQLPPLIQTDKFKTSICEPLFNDSETGRTLQTIDYVLLQECNWMNTYLKKIKHSVSELAKYLLLGLSSTPEHLREAAEALQMDKVPKSWLYPHYSHTAFHNIINWLQDVQKKHKQLKQWDKKGLMPFARGEKGALTSISLGGLFNPEALFLALRVEFSVHHGYLLHEVGLQCHIADYLDYKPDTAGYQLYLERLILQGAAWDFNNNCLKESSNTAHLLPFVIITPAFLGNTNPIDEDTETYDCPVYMDTAMQSCVLKLPLLCTKPVSQWHLRRVALILSPELNVTSSGKSVACQKKEPQTNFSTLKTLRKIDKSHLKIFKRASKPEESLVIEPQRVNEYSSTDVQRFSTEKIILENVPLDKVPDSKEFLQNTQCVALGETKDAVLSVLCSNEMMPNLEDKDILGASAGHKASVSDSEEHKDLQKHMTDEKDFIESEGAAESTKKKIIRDNSIVHIRNSDYESADNEDSHRHNNGDFDEAHKKRHKEDVDNVGKDRFEEGLQGRNDCRRSENRASSNYGWNNTVNNEQDFDYNNDGRYVDNDNKENTRGHITSQRDSECQEDIREQNTSFTDTEDVHRVRSK